MYWVIICVLYPRTFENEQLRSQAKIMIAYFTANNYTFKSIYVISLHTVNYNLINFRSGKTELTDLLASMLNIGFLPHPLKAIS